MTPITLAKDLNYVAAFLTFACQLRCPYCINHHGGDLVKGRKMSAHDWIEGLERLQLPQDVPITLQGGEPTVYAGFYEVASHKPFTGKLDLLTNLMLDEDVFMAKIPPEMFMRDAPYASIRVSWHIGQNDTYELLARVKKMLKAGYQVGIWAVDHPDHHEQILDAQRNAWHMGIDFRLKEFLGPHGGKEYGTFKYTNSVNSHDLSFCECRTSELLLSPDGHIFRCHADLYANRIPVGHILSERNPLVGKFLPCAVYGKCNSCDVKVKFNRHQQPGHSSVTIKNISEPYSKNNEYVKEVINTYGKQDSQKA